MAIVKEDSGRGSASSATQVTFGINPSGSDRFLAVAALGGKSAGISAAPTITLGAVSVGDNRHSQAHGTYWRHTIDTLTAPATGEQTVTVTWADTQNEACAIGGAWSGVDQTTPVDAGTIVSITSSGSVNLLDGSVASEAGDVVLQSLVHGGSLYSGVADGPTDATADASVTAVATGYINIRYGQIDFDAQAGSATADVGYTWTGYHNAILGAFNINASAGGGGSGNPWYHYAQQ